MLVQDQLKEPSTKAGKVIIPLNSFQNQGQLTTTSKSKSSGVIWTGLGILALCGICCSAPILAGIGAAIGATALLSFAWPTIGLGVAVLLGAILFIVILTRKYKATHSASMNSGASCSSSKCSVDGSCSCKK